MESEGSVEIEPGDTKQVSCPANSQINSQGGFVEINPGDTES